MRRYHWATAGDLNAFFGLMLDNIAMMVLLVSLLVGGFGFDVNFALSYMIPGTALGVMVGDLAFTAMAFRLARQSGRSDVTAMPLGIDTPSTFGSVLFVIGPAFLWASKEFPDPHQAALYAWRIGVCTLIISGIFKMACALISNWIRRNVPRAGLLGSLAAIALVLISFMPLLEVAHLPVVGYTALAVILTTLIARLPLPGRTPGALGALLVGTVIFYAMRWTGTLGLEAEALAIPGLEPSFGMLLPKFSLDWISVLGDSLKYLPVVFPFALGTIIGGIDCTESAAAAGDEYHTGAIIATEGVATLIAGLCGGVIQTTPYIGHPAYKAMGGRAAYTLATAIFIGGAGMFGYFSHIYAIIPKPAMFPILIFIGLEITAQSYRATPKRHYAAVALACAPALAFLAMTFVDEVLVAVNTTLDDLPSALSVKLYTLRILSAGFIVTSLLWSSALALLIDRRLIAAAVVFGTAAVCSFFGVIHSPLPGGPIILPWNDYHWTPAMATQTPYHIASAYAVVAGLLLAWNATIPWKDRTLPSAEDRDGGR